MTGIWISVSSRSKAPRSRSRMSSASAPSSAVTVSWPSMAMARATSVRIESSSSAISTRGIDTWSFASGPHGPCSYIAAGDIPPAEEAYIDIAPFRRRRSQPRLEPGSFPRLQHRLLQYRVPGIDLGALPVAPAKPPPRQFDRLAGFADDGALDHQHRLALDGFGGDLDVLEHDPAQIHVEADHFVEAGGLRQQPHHVDAPDPQRQHPRAQGGRDPGAADERLAGGAQQPRRFHQPPQPGPVLPAGGLGVGKVVPGYRRPVVSAKLVRALLVSGGRPVARYRRAVDDGGVLSLAVVFARESVPFRGGVRLRGLPTGSRNRGHRSGNLGRILRPCQPDLLAAGTADGTARRAQGSQINGIGGCTMGTNDVHGTNRHNDAAGMVQGDR